MNLAEPQKDISLILSSFWEEILPKLDAYAIPLVLERIQEWVGDDPEMTQVLCDYVVRYADRIDEGDAESIVDAIVHQEIIQNWRNSPLSDRFQAVEDKLLAYDRKDSLLLAYIRLLQKGKTPLNNSPEQRVLLQAGLAKTRRGRMRTTNLLYTKVFDLDWVEAQLPGITRPVSIVSAATKGDRPSSTSKFYSKVAIALCGLAVLGTAISSYLKESGGEAMATPDSTQPTLISAESTALNGPAVDAESNSLVAIDNRVESDGSAKSDSLAKSGSLAEPERALFDNGTEHAKNSRWVAMMREFCALPADSAYFTPAKKRLTQWTNLYPEDIKIAKGIVAQEKGDSCAISDVVLD